MSDGLISPSDIQFSPDGGTIYVSSLGGSGVARLRPDGTSAGAPIAFAPPTSSSQFQFSGLALLTPAGELLVGAFQDFPAGTSGAVGRYVSPNPTMDVFIPSATSLNGASGLLVHDGFVYVSGMFASNIQRFHLATGAVDSAFAITDLGNPQELMLAPDGNSFFAGILGLTDGEGRIAHYDFNGALIGDGIFAEPSDEGFTEATTFLTVPDPPPGDFNFDFRGRYRRFDHLARELPERLRHGHGRDGRRRRQRPRRRRRLARVAARRERTAAIARGAGSRTRRTCHHARLTQPIRATTTRRPVPRMIGPTFAAWERFPNFISARRRRLRRSPRLLASTRCNCDMACPPRRLHLPDF